jgi:hypothetical protein
MGQAKQSVHYNDWRDGTIDTIVGRDTLNVNCLILYAFYNNIFSKARNQQIKPEAKLKHIYDVPIPILF